MEIILHNANLPFSGFDCIWLLVFKLNIGDLKLLSATSSIVQSKVLRVIESGTKDRVLADNRTKLEVLHMPFLLSSTVFDQDVSSRSQKTDIRYQTVPLMWFHQNLPNAIINDQSTGSLGPAGHCVCRNEFGPLGQCTLPGVITDWIQAACHLVLGSEPSNGSHWTLITHYRNPRTIWWPEHYVRTIWTHRHIEIKGICIHLL